MQLRRQLLLVSLLTLSLPWAGCQYIHEMEGVIRSGQNRALLATAEAVASRIASEPLLVAELTQNFANVNPERQLYAQPLTIPIHVDGYSEEWRTIAWHTEQWQQQDLKLKLKVAYQYKHVYLLLQVQAKELHYYYPSQPGTEHADHIVLRTLDADGRIRDFILVASSPGLISAFDINLPSLNDALTTTILSDNNQLTSGNRQAYNPSKQVLVERRQEHAIKGVWQETTNGYQVEIQIPWYLTQGYLGVASVNPAAQDAAIWLGSIAENSPPAPLVKASEQLTNALAVFAGDDLRLRLATNNQWLLAEAGKLLAARDTAEQTGWLTYLLRRLFTQPKFPLLDQPDVDGRLTTNEILSALNGQEAVAWYATRPHSQPDDRQYTQSKQQQTLARAAVPIRYHDQVIGALVAEQSGASSLALTDTAFQRLLWYTILATGLASFGLLAYASWLSLRIRRLSRSVDHAASDNHVDAEIFTPSQAKDEIGDLSRSYHQLLTRVQAYTDYLRTLANKLSHELRTPLAVVRSSLDNLDNENLSDQAKIYAVRAHEGSQRLSSILNAMSSANRVEESIRHSDLINFSLAELVQQLTLAYQDIAQQTIVCVIEPNIDFTIKGAPELIVQLLDKLFDNACDFCPTEGTIRFSLIPAKDKLMLIVSNDGPLLPDYMQSQLFDSLVSIRTTSKDNNNQNIHLGLGLHIVRLIADLHQARVAATNRLDGSGVTFTVTFNAAS